MRPNPTRHAASVGESRGQEARTVACRRPQIWVPSRGRGPRCGATHPRRKVQGARSEVHKAHKVEQRPRVNCCIAGERGWGQQIRACSYPLACNVDLRRGGTFSLYLGESIAASRCDVASRYSRTVSGIFDASPFLTSASATAACRFTVIRAFQGRLQTVQGSEARADLLHHRHPILERVTAANAGRGGA